MSKYYGNINEDATIELTFNTFDSDGASVTATTLVSTDVQVYKDGVIQTTPGAGVTLTLNIGANNGSHLISIDTSNVTDAGFYAVGSNYEVRLDGMTVDTQIINAFIGSFSIENRFMRGTDNAALASGVNVTQISGDTTAADNLKLQYDTTGLTGDTFPATQAVTDRLALIQESDRIIDFTLGTLKYKNKDTGLILLNKNLKDPNNAVIDSPEDVIAAEEAP